MLTKILLDLSGKVFGELTVLHISEHQRKNCVSKKQYFLGTYANIEDATEACREAEEVLFDDVAEYYRKWKELADIDAEWAKANLVQVTVDQVEKRLNVMLFPNLQHYGE